MNTLAQMLWLLRHEWKLVLRAAPNTRWLWWLGLVVLVVAGLGSYIFRQSATWLPQVPSELPAGVLLFFTLGLLLILSIMVSVAIGSAVRMLFERGDMDLLLSSPLDTRLVLVSRGLWLAVSSFSTVAILVLPITLAAVVFVNVRLLGMLPVLVGLALLASGVGLLMTLGLVRLLGARRARTVAQVFGAVFGASFYLLTQLARFINTENLPWLAGLISWASTLAPSHWLLLPARAVWFDPFATLLWLMLSTLAFLGSVQLTHRAFLRGATAGVLGGKVKPPRQITPFASSLGLNVFRKEWRLVMRDPMLISQTLLQLIYLIPMFLAFFGSSSRSGRSSFDLQTLGTYPLLVVAAILAGGSLAQNITQIMVGAEDAAELIKMSPTSGSRVRNAKLFSAIAPIWVLFLPLIIWRGLLDSKHFFILIGFAAVTILGGLMILWTAKPFARSDFRQQTRKQHWLVGIALFFFAVAWCAALLMPLWLGLWTGFVAAGLGLLIPGLTYAVVKGNSSLGY